MGVVIENFMGYKGSVMTRKHFNAMADILRQDTDNIRAGIRLGTPEAKGRALQHRDAIHNLAACFERFSPTFDRDKWEAACHLEALELAIDTL